MGLGTAKAHILGRRCEAFVSEEDTPGYFLEPITTDSLNVISMNLNPNVKRKPRTDAYMATRDVLEQITDKSEHSWDMELFWCPSGTKNVAPDCGLLVEAALGTETVGSNDVTYSTASTQAIKTLTLTRHFQELYMEAMSGCWVEDLTLTFAAGEEPKLKVSGTGMDFAATGYGTLDGALSGTELAINVQTGEGASFHDPQSTSVYARSVIDIGSDSPTAAITAFANYGSGKVTVTSAAHKLSEGCRIVITGTTNYNGTYRVHNVATNTFTIIASWVADDATGTWTALGFHVTARTADALTIAPAIEAAVADDSAVVPYAPTHTDTGSPIAGVSGSLTWGGTSFAVTSAEVTVKNNHKALSDHAFVPHTDDVVPGIREVTGKFSCKMRQDYINAMLTRQDFGTAALVIVAGGAAQSGTRLQVSCPYCELMYTPAAIPEAEEGTFEFSFRALGSSGNDAITIMHT